MDNPPRFRGKFTKASRAKSLANLKTGHLPDNYTCVVDGSRIVDINFLAQQLVCTACENVLSLMDIQETRFGLACKWSIQCKNCSFRRFVFSSKRRLNQHTHRPNYDVNLKAAIGMIDAGIGATHVNAFLTCLNIPKVEESLLKRCERTVGPNIEKVANISCMEAALLESKWKQDGFADASKETDGDDESKDHTNNVLQENVPGGNISLNEEVSVVACYDMGWQKRGNGRSYSSLTGHGSLIGEQTKKIIAFGTRNISCKACSYSNDEHDCRRNWSGSAKGMEPDLAVELFAHSTPLKAAKVNVGTLVGDDDSSKTAKLRSEVGNIKKFSDLNHAKKNLGNLLYKIQKSHSILTPKIIKYFQRCFGYALQQNKGKPDELRKALKTIVPHAFDIHKGCGSWCGYSKDPVGYHHRGLPKGLEGDILFSKLQDVLTKFANNAECLAPCSSTQANESFNAIVASKAPKSRHYGSSESNDFRVAAAVCQKNVGVNYVANVKESLLISPGSHTLQYKEKLSNLRKLMQRKRNSLTFKRRRLFKTLRENSQTKIREAREGTTYCSGMSLNLNPLNSPFSVLKTLQPIIQSEFEVVFFDVETTGLSIDCDIIQIGAIGKNQFSAYITPTGTIPQEITNLTNLEMVGGQLCFKGQPVKSYAKKEACRLFLNFLKSDQKVLLVGHNVQFDARMTIAAIEDYQMMSDFENVVMGFADTYPLFKTLLPGRKSYTQESILKDCLSESFLKVGHNAHADASNLKYLCEKMVTNETLKKYSFTIESFLVRQDWLVNKRIRMATLNPLKEMGVSQYMIGRISDNGLNMQDLVETYKTLGKEGIEALFNVRKVTKNNVIITRICNSIEKI